MLDKSDTSKIVNSQLEACMLIAAQLDPDPEVSASFRFYTYGQQEIDVQIGAPDNTIGDAQQLAARLGFGGEECHKYTVVGTDSPSAHHHWSGWILEHRVTVITVQALAVTMADPAPVDDPGHPEAGQQPEPAEAI